MFLINGNFSLLSVETAESPDVGQSGPSEAPSAVIPSQGDLLGDLLNLDLAPPTATVPSVQPSMQMGAMDLLGGGLDSLVCLSHAASHFTPNIIIPSW